MRDYAIWPASRIEEADLKSVRKGDIITDRPCNQKDDLRTLEVISAWEIKLTIPSVAQINSESCFRNGDWEKYAISKIEPNWYYQRGYCFKESILEADFSND